MAALRFYFDAVTARSDAVFHITFRRWEPWRVFQRYIVTLTYDLIIQLEQISKTEE